MAILLSITVKGQTLEGYEGMLTAVKDRLQQAPGFIMHCARPATDGWELVEIWRTRADQQKWFAEAIVPNLPPGIHPKVTYHELHTAITAF